MVASVIMYIRLALEGLVWSGCPQQYMFVRWARDDTQFCRAVQARNMAWSAFPIHTKTNDADFTRQERVNEFRNNDRLGGEVR